MDTRTAIRRHEAEANRLHALVREAHRVRARSPRHHDRWVDAARAFRDHIARLKAERASLQAQDASAEGPLRAFLFAYATVDPYCFRSGYTLEALLRRAKRLSLTEGERDILRHLVLRRVAGPGLRSFRHVCRLIPKIETAAFAAALRQRA